MSRSSGVVLTLFAQDRSAEVVRSALERLDGRALDSIDSVALFVESSEFELVARSVAETPASRAGKLCLCADPRRYGVGGRRKIGLEYARDHDFRFALAAEARADVPWNSVVEMVARANELPHSAPCVVIGARRGRGGFGSFAVDRLLGLHVGDWASPLRLYSRELFESVPFQVAADDERFEIEILIQARALGATIAEVEVPDFECRPLAIGKSTWAAIDYRLHQLHVRRIGKFIVEPGGRYAFKHSPHGSHVQILDLIRGGTRVLDLGCSQGLLAAPLAAKQVRVVGVDAEDPSRVSKAMESYYRRNLEEPLELGEGRVFDYVVVSDVIEHLQNRVELLRSVRRHLKPDGRLLISTPNIAIWFYRLSLLAGRFEYGPRGVLDRTHVHLFTRSTFRREVESAGFRVVGERQTALPFELVFESTGQSRLVRFLSAAYHLAARSWPEMFAYQFILEAEVTTLHEAGAK